jgi:TIR domain
MAGVSFHRRLYRAFLSHAHSDKAIVDHLYAWLSETAEIPIWYDAHNLPASATIATELADAISQCRSMLIVLSKQSVTSGWVAEEYNAAIGQRTQYKEYRIIPVLIEECEIPGFLRATKWIEMRDESLDLRTANELVTGLYYDDKALKLENTWDIYISRSWGSSEAQIPDYVCKKLDETGFRLIGESEDQGRYDAERVKSTISSCGGLVAILPDRGQGRTSKYILQEIETAHTLGLPCLIVAEPTVELPEDLAKTALRMTIDDVGNSSHVETDLLKGIEILEEEWKRPPQPHYIFFATNFKSQNKQRNQGIKQAIQQITTIPCILGDEIREGQIQQDITEQISQASMVIADISEGNLNSCIEAGIALGTKRQLRLVAREPRDRTPYMLSNHHVFPYANDVELLGIIHRIAFPYRRRVLNSELA